MRLLNGATERNPKLSGAITACGIATAFILIAIEGCNERARKLLQKSSPVRSEENRLPQVEILKVDH